MYVRVNEIIIKIQEREKGKITMIRIGLGLKKKLYRYIHLI